MYGISLSWHLVASGAKCHGNKGQWDIRFSRNWSVHLCRKVHSVPPHSSTAKCV